MSAAYKTPLVRFVMIREQGATYEARPCLRDPADSYTVLRDYLMPLTTEGRQEPAVEQFVAAYLSVRHKLIALHTVSVGCVSSSLVHPREVFGPALTLRASAIVVAHNHPSGDPEPSADDVSLTRRLASAGTLLGVELLDHLVLTGEKYVSLKQRGAV